ncbi:MAG: hypothetical protein ACIAXF_04830 [Phycisphaerales bacterium JB063]
MRITPRLAAALSLLLLLLLTTAPPLVAQADEVEYAETPTNLRELIGEDQPDGVIYDYILDSTFSANGARTLTQQTCEQDDDGWHFTKREWMIGYNQTARTDWHFSPTGELVEYMLVSWSPATTLTRQVVRDCDSQEFIRKYEPNDDRESETFSDTIEIYRADDAIPDAWLTLAFAYHIRQEHEQFIIRTHTIPGPSMILVHTAENTGTETIQLHGEQTTVHVLVVDIYQEVDGQRVEGGSLAEATMYVLPDGSIAADRWEERSTNMTREAVTADEVDEILGEVTLPGNP